ncbi:MAG: aminopeptidase [Trueperaceae bacterium]
MIHPLHEKYAELLVSYCLEVEPAQQVLLDVATEAAPLARALYRAVLAAGGEPHLRLTYPEQAADLLELAGASVLDAEPAVQLAEMRLMDAYARVGAPDNSRSLQDADTSKLARLSRRMQEVMRTRMARRWVVTLFPTPASAQESGMSTGEYERFVYGSMFLYDADPAARWRELGAKQQRWISRLQRADKVTIEGPGTDLSLSVKGRTWANSDGKRNMPSGEVFTGPLEDSANGVISFEIPSNVDGALVEGVRLRFENGKVVEAHARRGQELLNEKLATDPGARFLGELGIGTNPHIDRPTLKTLYDEKILGTIHLALGRSYPETGGTNESAIHWDLVCDLRTEGRVLLDGEVFLENGRLVS